MPFETDAQKNVYEMIVPWMKDIWGELARFQEDQPVIVVDVGSTLALVVDGTPVIALATQPELEEKMVSNIKEVKARGARVLAVTLAGNNHLEEVADEVFYIPRTHPLLAPVLAVIPLQLFAYYAAVARGCEVDKPRNLAKSVTVE